MYPSLPPMAESNDLRKKVVKVCLDFGCLTVVAIPLLCLYLSGRPFRRGFYCDDTSIRYPYKDSTVSSALLHVYSIGIPTLTILIVEFVRFSNSIGNLRWITTSSSERTNFLWITYNELVVFVFGALASQFCTDIAKYSIGRLRPHFLDVCRPAGLDTTLCPPNYQIYRYIENYECTANYDSAEKVRDARLSFMSGHSSWSAYAMVFTVIYIQYKVKWQALSLLRPLVQMSLIYLSIYTGFSRISDYKHHWSDVLIGLIQGTLSAILTTHYVGRFFRRYPDNVRDPERVTTYVRPPSVQPSPSIPPRSPQSYRTSLSASVNGNNPNQQQQQQTTNTKIPFSNPSSLEMSQQMP